MNEITLTDKVGVELIERWGSDEKIAHAARTSTKGLDNQQGRVGGLVRALWREGHYSPFEHQGATFALHVPMFVRDQIVRHKSLSFSIQSGRYMEFEPVFYSPESAPLVEVGRALDYEREDGGTHLRTTKQASDWALFEYAWGVYQYQRELGVSKEEARTVLPSATYTSMWVSGNLRSWLHFLHARIDPHAQNAVWNVAWGVSDILSDEFPIAHEAWREANANQ